MERECSYAIELSSEVRGRLKKLGGLMRKFIFICGMGFWSVPILSGLMQNSLYATTRHIYEADGAQGVQDSINASGAYDTVFVHTGTYYVREVDSLGITMKDSVILISPHPDSVTLSGLNSAGNDTALHVIYCNFGDSSSHAAMIVGFTITGGYAFPSPCGGGGIYCDYSSPTIEGNVIVSNRGFHAGGIGCDSSSPIITKNTIINNYGYEGGGIGCWNSSPIISHNIIKNDSTDGNGGGIRCSECSGIIENNIITDNSAGFLAGGGGIASLYSSLIIRNNIISDNFAAGGSGLGFSRSNAIVEYNVITNNLAQFMTYGYGGGVYCEDSAFVKISHSLIAGNIAQGEGGAIYGEEHGGKISVDSSFIVDNGSISHHTPGGSGLACFKNGADTLRIQYSNLYYNTFQPDTEIDNMTYIQIPLMYNFWWDTINTEITSKLRGPFWITPWMYDFIPGVPGEPITIDSVRNYDSTYSFIIDSLENDPDTLYLRIYGQDRLASMREAAVAIIKSSIYPNGIAVALIETDTNSGVYHGKATIKVTTGNDTIRLDDIYNIVKADTGCNEITITANMDTMQEFVVFYRCAIGVEENAKFKVQNAKLEAYPNPLTGITQVRYSVPKLSHVNITAYNLSGQIVATIVDEKKKAGYYTAEWDAYHNLSSGIYFIRLTTNSPDGAYYIQMKKIALIR